MLALLLEMTGYWEDEPKNGCVIWISLGAITYVSAFSRDNIGKTLEFAIHMPNTDYPFIVSYDELEKVTTLGSNGFPPPGYEEN